MFLLTVLEQTWARSLNIYVTDSNEGIYTRVRPWASRPFKYDCFQELDEFGRTERGPFCDVDMGSSAQSEGFRVRVNHTHK